MRLTIRLITTLLIFPLCASGSQMVRADCEWPPLNAVEERQSNPVRVGDATFTTGYYSYWVRAYRIDSLHCTDSIDIGPRHWRAIVGLGGDEPIGPRASSGSTSTNRLTAGAPSSVPPAPTTMPTLPTLPTLSPASTALPNLPQLAPVEQWRPLPALPDVTTSALPALPPLTP